MNSSQRREEKKRRREKRLSKRDQARRELGSVIDMLDRLASIPSPASWPGACDATLARPDLVKFEFATFVGQGSGRDYLRRFERSVKVGLIGRFPEVDHWAMEEFFWHGSPEHAWQPMDAFLNSPAGSRFPPAAREQLLRWKQARIGYHEVGPVEGDTVAFRELDAVTLRPIGRWVGAIALNIGGVNLYATERGKIALTYLAPWAPDKDLFCSMGYGKCLTPDQCVMGVPLILGMRNVKAITFPLPWRVGKTPLEQCLDQWRRRDWYQWMTERVRFPFQAIVMMGPAETHILTIDMMVTKSAAEFRNMGLYFAGSINKEEVGVLGGSMITPLDVESPNALAFAEYQAYRDLVGPPPATRDW